MDRYTFTVFTATYNRADTLHRVRDSLAEQTFTDFEWLVVDDGSQDRTRELVDDWSSSSDFPIRYIYKPNGGKHTAWNVGVREARGELFLSLDSDDACVPNALERFKHHWDSIPDDERAGFSAVTALCIDLDGNLVGTRFPRSPLDSDPVEVRYRYRLRGEKWGFHRTAVLREFPFPEPADRGFVSERLVWDRIAARYRTRYVNEELRIYDDRPGRVSLSSEWKNPARHAEMYSTIFREQLTDQLRWMRHAPLRFAIDAAQFSRFALHRGASPLREIMSLPLRGRLLGLATLPLGVGLYVRDRRRSGARK
jgi:glycosyltransferase involved in cell wall biosynthesis